MNKKTFNERELLEGLDAESAHADELATLLPHELTPLERLNSLVLRYDRPTDPVWDEWFDSDEGASEDFMQYREEPPKNRE